MSERILTEILAAHADHLARGEDREEDYLTLFAEYRKDLAPLLGIARQVKEVLAQVQPSEAFRRRLHNELVAAARQRLAVDPRRYRSVWRRPWVIGVAALGSAVSIASALGVIAYLRRSKATKPAAVTG
jgi:hypothetical protein